MTLSPEQKKQVVDQTAEKLVEELKADMGGSFQSLYCIPLAVAEKMTGLCKRTIRTQLPIIEVSEGKHAVRLSDLHEYLCMKTTSPGKRR